MYYVAIYRKRPFYPKELVAQLNFHSRVQRDFVVHLFEAITEYGNTSQITNDGIYRYCAKAVKSKDLPSLPDWFRWDSAMGMTDMPIGCLRLGHYFEDCGPVRLLVLAVTRLEGAAIDHGRAALGDLVSRSQQLAIKDYMDKFGGGAA